MVPIRHIDQIRPFNGSGAQTLVEVVAGLPPLLDAEAHFGRIIRRNLDRGEAEPWQPKELPRASAIEHRARSIPDFHGAIHEGEDVLARFLNTRSLQVRKQLRPAQRRRAERQLQTE